MSEIMGKAYVGFLHYQSFADGKVGQAIRHIVEPENERNLGRMNCQKINLLSWKLSAPWPPMYY